MKHKQDLVKRVVIATMLLAVAPFLMVGIGKSQAQSYSISASDESIDSKVNTSSGSAPMKMVALTFDDGPDRTYTEAVLDVLKEYNVKGTFFVIGGQVKQYPDTMQRMVREGHEVGNHSWSHPHLTKLSKEKIHNELANTDKVIREISGVTPRLMRPPYGATSVQVKKEIQAAGHVQALWDVDTRDWTSPSVAEILKAVKSNSSNKITVLMHSGGGKRENTVKALPQIINYYKSQGYTLVTMSQLNGTDEKVDSPSKPTDQNQIPVTPIPSMTNGTPMEPMMATITVDNLNIRKGSGLQYPVITQLHRDDQVTLVAKEADWYRVKLSDGRTGWANAIYLSIQQNASSSSSEPVGINPRVEREIYLMLNDTKVRFQDAKPYIDANDRVQVPLRFIAEALNFHVAWEVTGNRKTARLTKDQVNIALNIGDRLAVVNGVQLEMDTSAAIVQEYTFVPLKFLGELVGMDIRWDSVNGAVTIIDDHTADMDSTGNTSSETPILSAPRATVQQAKAWAESKGASAVFIELADIVWNEAPAVGVDPLVVYTQSAKETGYGNFGGVLDDMFMNPAGLKTQAGGSDIDQGAHQRFFSWEEGVRAQIDHLALYAGARGYPRTDTVDPRHFPHLMGKATTVESLGGAWASSPTYGIEIVNMMSEVSNSNF
ncbi:polysaccharide deacetylase family protein [Paenibacillus massiliensis]|uniref:polysaccharide deacetylase family protein n=1 Tax=Paenibacillus massiliensis TaxID=225917 RepID=UPI0004B7DD44|nr:polysaccharide deacetylase family protein [Paenibacillus massiliensis]